MPTDTPMPASQRIVQVCLFLFAAIGLSGGALQMYLGQPANVHRFLAGIYLGCGLICLWAAITVRQQRTLVLLLGLAVLLAGMGRLWSMRIVGLPEPAALWLGYLVPELLVSLLMIGAQLIANRTLARQGS
jgi:Domain of unknown function (DUF4345)